MQETQNPEFQDESCCSNTLASEEALLQKPGIKRLIAALILILASAFMLKTAVSTYISGFATLSYKMADGRVQEIEEHYDALGIRKEVLLNYQINGKELQARGNLPAGRVMKPGELTAVYYNADNPAEIALSKEIDYDMVTVMGAFGLFVLSFGGFILLRYLNAIKCWKASKEQSQSS